MLADGLSTASGRKGTWQAEGRVIARAGKPVNNIARFARVPRRAGIARSAAVGHEPRGSLFVGSGSYFQSLTGLNRFGSNAGQRLRPDGSVIPVCDLKGQALHKLDVRLSKEVRLAGTAEVFNLLNHANYVLVVFPAGRAPARQRRGTNRASTLTEGL